MNRTSWDESTESQFLSGVGLPPEGLACTLTSIRSDMMDKREGSGQEQVFIGAFAELDKEWVINKTGRKFLKAHCGITNANVSNFPPVALTLIPNETNKGTGIKPILRVVNAPAVATAPPAAPPEGPPPAASDEVPF